MRSLFRNIPRKEGAYLNKDTGIIYGKCTRHSNEIQRLGDGTALDNDNVPDGWYVLINFPIRKIKKYLCYTEFYYKDGLCFPRFLIRARKVGPFGKRKWKMTANFVWCPVENLHESKIELRYDDPYLSSINTITRTEGK